MENISIAAAYACGRGRPRTEQITALRQPSVACQLLLLQQGQGQASVTCTQLASGEGHSGMWVPPACVTCREARAALFHITISKAEAE